MRIFISYRRRPEGDPAAFFVDSLQGAVRRAMEASSDGGAVFYDHESIELGLDFRDRIEAGLAESDVFLAVVDERFVDELRRREEAGTDDWVRFELRRALERGVPVIPVLPPWVKALPSPDELPDDLAQLAFRNGYQVEEPPNVERSIEHLVERILDESRRQAEAADAAAAHAQTEEPVRWGSFFPVEGVCAVIVTTEGLRPLVLSGGRLWFEGERHESSVSVPTVFEPSGAVVTPDGRHLVSADDQQIVVQSLPAVAGPPALFPLPGTARLQAAWQHGSFLRLVRQIEDGSELTDLSLEGSQRTTTPTADQVVVGTARGSLAIDRDGCLRGDGHLEDVFRGLPQGGWQVLDLAEAAGRTVVAGVREEEGRSVLHAERFDGTRRAEAVSRPLPAGARAVLVARPGPSDPPPGDVYVVVDDGLGGWSWADLEDAGAR